MLSASRLFFYALATLGCTMLSNAAERDSKDNVLNDAAKASNTVQSSIVDPVSASPRLIHESVNRALLTHPRLLGLRQDSNIEKAALRELRADVLPQISLTLGLGKEHSNNQTTRANAADASDEYVRKESALRLRQTLFDGFKSSYSIDAKESELRAVTFNYLHKASEVALLAIEAHLGVLKARDVLAQNVRNLEAHERIAKDIGIRARSGKDDRAKVNQISARLSLSMANLEIARQSLSSQEVLYKSVVGVMPSSSLVTPESINGLLSSKADFFDAAKNNSAALKSARHYLEAAQSRASSEQSDYSPEVYLEAGASWNDNLDGVSGRNDDAFVMLRMDYALYDGGARYARQKRTRLQQDRALYDLSLVESELERDVNSAWHESEALQRRKKWLEDYVDAAENTKSAYVKQFTIGQRSLIDLLDAENEVMQARRMLIDARYELHMSRYKMLHLQGSLLDH